MFGHCLISVAKSKNLFKVKPAAILLAYNIFVTNAYTKNGRRGTTLRAPRLPANREIEIIYDRIRLYKEFAGGKNFIYCLLFAAAAEVAEETSVTFAAATYEKERHRQTVATVEETV